jgi:hypothetical protein
MKNAQNKWNERIATPTTIPGTKLRNAAVGAGAGAVGGGVLAAIVGGVGVVVAGTGVGLPAGLALIATSAVIGAGAGAVTGAATGESPTTVVKMTTIAHADPAYGPWQWGIVVANAFVLFLFAVLEIRGRKTRTPADEQKSEGQSTAAADG